MKWLYAAIGILAAVPLLYFVVMYAASELGGEVVVLHRAAEDGSINRVRLWIVADGSGTWIEHGSPDAAWIARLAHDPVVTVERNGVPRQYRASPDPASHALYHRLRQDRYGFADRLLEVVAGDPDACPTAPVRLEPYRPGAPARAGW